VAWWLVLSGALLSGVFVWFFSNDWFCSVLGAVLFTVAMLMISEVIVSRVQTKRVGLVRSARLVWAVIVACGVGLYFRADPNGLFEQAFGVRPPDGVTDLEGERHMGPGETTILLQFTADRSTIDKLVALREFKPDDRHLDMYWKEDRDAKKLWHEMFARLILFAGPKWKQAPQISSPVLYHLQRRQYVDWATLLWDAETRKGYVMWLQ
jgi:hypothetical protein